MADTRYDVQIDGALVGGADPAAVRNNLMKLFKVDAARAGVMLSGKTVTLKRNTDKATAMKFRAALQRAGAQCTMVALDDDADESITLSPAPLPESDTSANENNSGNMETVGTIRVSGDGFSGKFGVAPAGADMGQAKAPPAPPAPDTSSISLAPAGSDMGQKPADPPPPPPDTSKLSIKEKD